MQKSPHIYTTRSGVMYGFFPIKKPKLKQRPLETSAERMEWLLRASRPVPSESDMKKVAAALNEALVPKAK